MKRLVLPILLLGLALPLWSLDQTFLEPTVPISSTLKGQGGVSTANAEGWDALFVNPAAYASPTVSITFLSVGGTGFIPLSFIGQTLDNRDSWSNFDFTDPDNPNTALLNSLMTEYGVGGEVTVGMGWVGNKLGVGFLTEARTFAKGNSLLGATMLVEQTTTGVVGMGWPFDVGLGTLKVGGALRPLQKTYANIPASDILGNLGNISGQTIQSGFGLATDFGLRWDYADFKTGLVVRDIGGTVVWLKEYEGSDWISGFGFPTGGDSTEDRVYRLPTVIGLGGSWSPSLGTLDAVFRSTISADLQIPIQDEYTQPSFWTWTHVGAEARFLQFLSIRAGLNQGYFTFGLGARALLFDFNLAIYADELGRYSGINRRSAISMDFAFRL